MAPKKDKKATKKALAAKETKGKEASNPDETGTSHKEDEASKKSSEEDLENNNEEEAEPEEPKRPLDKSPRIKGYLTIAFSSIIQFREALISNEPINARAVSASLQQKRYATTVSITSASIACALILIHLDRYSPFQKFWYRLFSPKSNFEWFVIIFLLLWWFIATVVQTGVRGICGDGKGQYNLYFSTWVCMWASLYCMDKKLIDNGWTGFRSFISSWPFRAPGWIAIFASCFFTLFWYLDLFLNTSKNTSKLSDALKVFYATVPDSQYQWLLFLSAFTLVPSAVFVFVEIFRETTINQKSNLETILEGFFLFLLVIGWIPAVVITTTPGGFASLVGNSYFFTWGTTALVMETFLWFVHDCRASIHSQLQEKEREYKRHQEQVLQHAKRIAERYEDDQSANDGGDNSTAGRRPLQRRLYSDQDDIVLTDPPRLPRSIGKDDTARTRPRLQSNGSEYFDALEDIQE